MGQGWIRLHRKALDSRVFADDWLWRLWCWCLLRASWKAAHILHGKSLRPGQFVCGRQEAARELGVSPSKWYRGIQTLVCWGQLSIEANSRWTTITICNWETYQHDCCESEQPVNSRWTAGGQPSLREEGEEGEEGARVAAPAPDGKPLAQGTLAAFETTAPGLAQAWCFYLSRKKLGGPKDLVLDMEAEFAELLRRGFDGRKLLDAVLHERRDRGEYFWQFKERVLSQGATAAPPESAAEKKARVALDRARAAESAAHADPEAVKRALAERQHRNGQAAKGETPCP